MTEEFQKAGLLWFINNLLHIFGWALSVKHIDGESYLQPIRVKFRGFPEDSNTLGYYRVTKHMQENSENLIKSFDEKEIEEILKKRG